MDTVTTTLRAWALHFAARGWHVFPITPSAKKPPVIDRWETRATSRGVQPHSAPTRDSAAVVRSARATASWSSPAPTSWPRA